MRVGEGVSIVVGMCVFLLLEESDSGFDMGLNWYDEFCQVFIILLGPYNKLLFSRKQ